MKKIILFATLPLLTISSITFSAPLTPNKEIAKQAAPNRIEISENPALTQSDVTSISDNLHSVINLNFKPECKIFSDFGSIAFNALTDGKNIYVGSGLLKILTYDELKAIIAHEFGHIKLEHVKKKSKRTFFHKTLLFLCPAAVGPSVASKLFLLKKDRDSEYEADEFSAKITGNPMALASALDKIELATAQSIVNMMPSKFKNFTKITPSNLKSFSNHLLKFMEPLIDHPETKKRKSKLETIAAEQESARLLL
jgi:Zn-dependent protease with chaperone function